MLYVNTMFSIKLSLHSSAMLKIVLDFLLIKFAFNIYFTLTIVTGLLHVQNYGNRSTIFEQYAILVETLKMLKI